MPSKTTIALVTGSFVLAALLAFLKDVEDIPWIHEHWVVVILLVFPGCFLLCCYGVLINYLMNESLAKLDAWLVRKSGKAKTGRSPIAEFLETPNWLRPICPKDVLQLFRLLGWIDTGTGAGVMSVIAASATTKCLGIVLFAIGLAFLFNT